MKSLAIILLNWNDESTTSKCIDRIKQWKSIDYEIFIVDNHSSDEQIRAASHPFNDFQFIHNPVNGGYAGGNNLGIKKAMELECPFVLLLNTDAYISEVNLSVLIDCLRRNPEIDIIGPVISEKLDNKTKHYIGGRDIGLNLNTRVTFNSKPTELKPEHTIFKPDYVPGTVLLIRTRLFKEIGLLDESYFFSGEIADFCRRAQKIGKKAFIHLGSNAIHSPELRPRDYRNILYPYYNLRNRFLYTSKHYRHLRLLLYLKWIGLGVWQYVGAQIYGYPNRARAIRIALKHGLTGTFGNQNEIFIDNSC